MRNWNWLLLLQAILLLWQYLAKRRKGVAENDEYRKPGFFAEVMQQYNEQQAHLPVEPDDGELALQPWELPPGYRGLYRDKVDYQSDIRGVPVRGRWVRLGRGRWVLFVRRLGQNYIVINGQTGGPQIWQGKPVSRKKQGIIEQMRWGNSLRLAALRTIPPSQPAGHSIVALCVVPLTKLSVTQGAATLLDEKLENPLNLRFDPAKDGFEQLQAHHKSPGSITEFAWNWWSVSEQQRRAMDEEERARLLQMKRLMRCVLWCLPEVWAATDGVSLLFTPRHIPYQWFDSLNTASYQAAHIELSPATAALIEAWGEELERHFLPLVGEELYQLNPQMQRQTAPPRGNLVGAPTATEQLQAHIELRAWLRIHAPAQEERLMAFPRTRE